MKSAQSTRAFDAVHSVHVHVCAIDARSIAELLEACFTIDRHVAFIAEAFEEQYHHLLIDRLSSQSSNVNEHSSLIATMG